MRATGVPIGLGSFVQWDRKLDGRLAQAVMSMQAVKGVEIGGGFTTARLPGSRCRTCILPREQWGDRPWQHATNRAGGLEGGVTNGEDVVVRGALKPISTLPRPLPTADLITAELTQRLLRALRRLRRPRRRRHRRGDGRHRPRRRGAGEVRRRPPRARRCATIEAYMKTIGPRGRSDAMTAARKPAKPKKDGKKKKEKPKAIPLSDRIDDPEILEVLRQPVGTPFKLTREQALIVLKAGMGGRPDLPTGAEYVRQVRKKYGIRARG